MFYIFYKGNVLSFQCKMSPDRSTSTGEIDGMSLIFIDHTTTLLKWGRFAAF